MFNYKKQFESEYSTQELYNLVADVESYPKFLPWCIDVRVHSTKESHICFANMIIQFKSLQEQYCSKITFDPYKFILVEAVDGPFDFLYNSWNFDTEKNKTIVSFEIKFKLKSFILNNLFGSMIEKHFNTITDAFITRSHIICQK